MTMLGLVLFTLLSLAAGQSDISGYDMKRQGAVGGPIVTTTVTTIIDLSSSSSRMSPSQFCDRETYKILGQKDTDVILNTWDILKRSVDFAPKLFMRYFKAKPESQNLFPEFANVPLGELPANRDFLRSAYNCINSLNFMLSYLKYDHPERCPSFPSQLKNKYHKVDLKKFGAIWMTAMQEELGNAFTDEVRDVWKKSVMAVIDFASK